MLSSAFSDLNALMDSAQEMVKLASNISAKVATIKGSDSNSKEIIEFRNSLMTLGINDPVTRHEAKTDYFKKLSKELQEFLDIYLKNRHPKIISTVDLYCLFNRARGYGKYFKFLFQDMISPQDLITACELFSQSDSGYKLRCFDSGCKFIQSTRLNDDDFCKKVLNLLAHQEYLTSSFVATSEQISIILAKEELMVNSKE